MDLTVIGSGSDGNCYLLACQGEILILECGCHVREVKKKLGFDLSHLAGCFVSHVHSDHAGYVKEFASLGIPIFTPYKTGLERVSTRMKGFFLEAFMVPHGDTCCYGMLISHRSGEKAIYITDFRYCKYRFDKIGVQHFFVECNYQKEYIDPDAPNYAHKAGAHCSLDTCLGFVAANKTDALRSVILMHLGAGSIGAEMVEKVKEAVPGPVFVDYARADECYELGG